jgi:hypothetical protein
MEPLLPNLRPISIAMSRNNTFIAVGYGSLVQLYSFHGPTRNWAINIPIKKIETPENSRAQTISFSPDSRYVTVATQRYDKMRGRDDNAVWTRVWRCAEYPGEGTLMGFCHMPTDRFGVTAAFFDATVNLTFMTGFIDSPYPLFHRSSGGPSDGGHGASGAQMTPLPQDMPNISVSRPVSYKIRCASQAPNHSGITFLTSQNQLYRADVKTQTVELRCDLTAERKILPPSEEEAVIGIPRDDIAYVAWKEGTKLHVVEIGDDGARREKMDLRWLIEAVGWGDD